MANAAQKEPHGAKGRGKGGRRRAPARRGVLPAAGRRAPARRGVPAQGGYDARTAKAQGIVQAARVQLKSLSQENWSQLVIEGNVIKRIPRAVGMKILGAQVTPQDTLDVQDAMTQSGFS